MNRSSKRSNSEFNPRARFLLGIFLAIVLLTALGQFPQTVHAKIGTPYGNVPWSIPGTIEIEDFDLGGEGVAYHDTDPTNNGGQYRPNEGVDIEITPDGSGSHYQVGWTNAGEWLNYTVNVATTGTYTMTMRAAAADSTGGGKFHIELDGVNLSGAIDVVYGVWLGYSTIVVPNLSMPAGQHTLKLVMDTNATSGGVGSFNWMHFDLASPVPPPTPVIIPTPVPGNIFYVSPTGNDSNSGSITQPWKTLAKAADTLTPGQTVYLRAGTYKESLRPKNSGTADKYIIYMAYPNEAVTLDGTGLSIPRLQGLVNLRNKSFIRISGLRVINAGAGVTDGTWNMGISAQSSDHLVIDHNYVAHTFSSGIDINQFSSFVLIDHNQVTDTNFGDNDDEVALGVGWFSHDIELSNNQVHDVKDEGIDPVAGAHDVKIHDNVVHAAGNDNGWRVGIYVDAWTEHEYNIAVYNNTIYNNNGQAIAVGSEGGGLMENVQIFNNVIYDSGLSWGAIGIAPWSTTTSPTHPVRNIYILNNTVYNNVGGGVVVNNPEAKNILIRNNILYQNLNGAIRIDPSVPPSSVIQDHNLTSDPLFVNATVADFHLRAGSPAIDAGASALAPTFDKDQKPRPIGAAVDIGAYEAGGAPPSPTPTATVKPTATATPTAAPTPHSTHIYLPFIE